jgi:glycogen synthase
MQSKGYKVVANVGRLTVQKGLTNFLKAAQRVISVHPKTLFLIVGNGRTVRRTYKSYSRN